MAQKIGRNDPCPCGSGKKYKRCHMAEEEALRGGRAKAERLGVLLGELTNAIYGYALDRFGEGCDDPAFEIFFEPEVALPFLVPYLAYHVPIEGRVAAEWYRDAHERDLSADARACLDAERASWLSLWRVVESRPRDGLVLRDRLTGEVRDVIERTASQTLMAGDNVLCRLVDLAGFTSINGLYPFALSEFQATEVELRMRGHLRRKRDVPVERLREPKAMRYLIRRVDEQAESMQETPVLCNNDGDPILFTTDHFEIEGGQRAEVERRLAALPEVDGPELGEVDPDEAFVFLGRDKVVLGQAQLTARRLRIDSNSVERADRLRRRVEEKCGRVVRHLLREHGDPLSDAAMGEAAAAPVAPTDPGALALARTMKERHYAEWIDIPVPALGEETPRAAVSTKEGRARVEALLADFERAERSLDPAERVDFGKVRRELGI